MHGVAVTVTSWGLRGVRAVETGAEKARLATADILRVAPSSALMGLKALLGLAT